MAVTLELFELRKLMTDAAEMGAQQALIKVGLTSRVISAKVAYDIYGRKIVDKWVAERLIARIKHGEKNSSVKFDAVALEALAKSSNRHSFFINLEQRNADNVV